MNLKEQAVFLCQFFSRFKGFRGTGVGGMAENRRPYARILAGPPFGEPAGNRDVFLRIGDARGRKVDHSLAQDSAQTAGRNRFGHRLFKEVAVAASRGSRQHHLRAG